MEDLGPLLEQVHRLPCPQCSQRLDGASVTSVERSGERWCVLLVCPACSGSCLAMIEKAADLVAKPPALGVDDVLDAHELLNTSDASLRRLFGIGRKASALKT